MDEEQVYFVLNKIDDACYGRQQSGKIVKSPKITTNDNDITRRRWVLCDFDPIRKSGTNASDEEFELAHGKAQEVFSFLREKGFNNPIICKSGNGWHLLYKIDEDVSDETTEIIRGFFKYMGSKFSDDKVEFDEKNFNAARLCKLYGTMAKKGANLTDRPWRMSEIVYVPQDIQTTPLEKFKELADLVPKEEPKTAPNRQRHNYGNNTPFDLRTWLNDHAIVYKEESQGGGTKFVLEHCPWEDTHSNRQSWDSALFQDADGKIKFNCFHSHCKDKTWFDFRLFYEPNAYDKPAYQPQQVVYIPQQFIQQPKKKYEIKEVIPELGEKWLSMSSIEKVDIAALEHVKTGFTELDRSILGLFMSEVTILSGSNASGKSSWLNTLLLNITQQGYKSALWSGELPDYILSAWIRMVAAGKRNMRLSQYGDGKYYVPSQICERIDAWLDGKLFIYNNEYGTKWEQIFHDMELLLQVGVKIFVLDNLFSLDIDILEGDKNNKQKELILQIKDFAKRNKVHIILVAHPRKTIAFLRKNDISGTSDLQNAVDKIFIIHRVNHDFLRVGADFFGASEIQKFGSFGNVVEVCKERLFGIVDLMVGMQYEVESRRFKNTLDEDIHYAWEQIPTEQKIEFNEPKPQSPYESITEEELLTQKEAPF